MLFLKNNYKFKNIAGTPIKNTFAIKSRLNCNTAGTIKTKKVINKTMQTLMSYGFKNLQVFDTFYLRFPKCKISKYSKRLLIQTQIYRNTKKH